MPNQVVGTVPEFTSDEVTDETGIEEVNEAPVEETVEEGSDAPTEPPAVETPAEPVPETEATGDDEMVRAMQGLQNERAKLLKEISELKGQRREIKREELTKVETRLDELKDVNPADVGLIDRVIRAKGFVTKDEANRMFYDAVKNDALTQFLEKYPEYKPENDSGDVNWTTLQRELGYYRMPDDPHLIADVLEKAHRGIARAPSYQAPARKHQAEIASVGSGGVQRTSSTKSLDSRKRAILEAGGWSSEEIARIEKQLS